MQIFGKCFGSLFIGAIIWSLSCSATLPISKRTEDYHVCKTAKARLLYRKRADLDLIPNIDSLITIIESKHHLSIKQPIDIFLCGSEEEFVKIAGHSGPRAKTYPPNGRLFINAKLIKQYRNGETPIDVFLKHEISHSIVFQHRSFLSYFILSRNLAREKT